MSENKFGFEKMFKGTRAHDPSDDELNQLAEFMVVDRNPVPAGYTYLGQFIDHDLALDSAAGGFPGTQIRSEDIFNKRTPFLNLETIYGFEAPTNPDEPRREELLQTDSKTLLKLGATTKGLTVDIPFADKDLPRRPNSPLALIVDKRNDENLAVAQTQVAFMRFHNAVVRHIGDDNTTTTFEAARKIVIQHYQWIILRDYLRKIIKASVLEDVLTRGNQFYFPDPASPFIPLEFSVAAFRLGHSMIRNSYNWNRIFNDDPFPVEPATLRQLTENTGRGGLGNNLQLVSDWLINWNWFYDISGKAQRQKLNFAPNIDTKIARQLGFLPNHQGVFPESFVRETSLPALDLYRARALGIPSGQVVANSILGTRNQSLEPEQIADLLPETLKDSLSKATPLWFYLLAEAEIKEHGQTLGEVGSRIIAETFVHLIRLSEHSIIDTDFEPIPEFHDGAAEFGIVQMLKFIAGGKESELDPVGEFISNQQ